MCYETVSRMSAEIRDLRIRVAALEYRLAPDRSTSPIFPRWAPDRTVLLAFPEWIGPPSGQGPDVDAYFWDAMSTRVVYNVRPLVIPWPRLTSYPPTHAGI